MQTWAADRIFRLLQVHITFRVTFEFFLVIVAYDVAIVLFQICMNSPVHRIKQKISYQSDSVQHRTAFFSVVVCIFSVDFVMRVSL